MRATRILMFALSTLLILSGSPLRSSAHVRNIEPPAPVLYVSANPASMPIGTFEATSRLVINGRVVDNHGALWNDELLHVPMGASARADLPGIGQITLAGGTMAKLMTNAAAITPADRARMLTMVILSGNLSVQLAPGTGAYLLTGGRTYTATAGAVFDLNIRTEQPEINNRRGEVRHIGSWKIHSSFFTASNPEAVRNDRLFNAWPAVRLPSELKVAATNRATARESLALTSPEKPTGTVTKQSALLDSLRPVTSSIPVARLHANPLTGLIGRVETPGTMKINGRTAYGKEMLWDGEVVAAPADLPVQVSLDGIGSLTIPAASAVRIRAATTDDVRQTRRVLVASVISGACTIRLQENSGAFVEADGATFAAEGGAHFRIGTHTPEAVMEISSGVVSPVGRYVIELTRPALETLSEIARTKVTTARGNYRITPLDLSYQIVVPSGSRRGLKFRITDEKGRAAAGMPVTFTLKSLEQSGISGSFGSSVINARSYIATTNTHGLVILPFTAATTPGSSVIIAVIGDEPPQQAALLTSLDNGHSGFWHKRTAVPVFLTAAAMIAAGVTVVVTKEERLPIRGSGETVIVP